MSENENQDNSAIERLFSYDDELKAPKTTNFKPRLTGEEVKKKYFTPLEDETSFRILPPKDGNIHFEEAYFHEVMVNGKIKKMPCLKHYDGSECPLCEHYDQLVKISNDKTLYPTEEERKKQFGAAFKFMARKFYVVKGIDRNHEGDGVKFWRFKENKKKDGIYDKIMPVVRGYYKRTQIDFTDIEKGLDLVITTVEDTIPGTSKTYRKVSSIISHMPEPLHTKEAKVKEWTEDTLTWRDIYKPVDIYGHMNAKEYLEAVRDNKAPMWDDKNRTWLFKDDKGEWYTKARKEEIEKTEASDADVAGATSMGIGNLAKSLPAQPETSTFDDGDDDLPF
jgi:hypothetical protein